MITSTANEKVKFLRSLHQARSRRESGCFLVEGVRLVEEALLAGVKPATVLIDREHLDRSERGRALAEALLRQGALEANERVLSAVATTVTPQGVVAAVPIPVPISQGELGELGGLDLGPLVPILDHLADPGNVGTILRTSEAAGITTVVALNDTVDLFSPKVVRAGAGAHFHLNLLVDESLGTLKQLLKDRPVRATAVNGGQWHYQVDWTIPSAFIIGSEAHGVSAEGMAIADELVSIPMVGRAESLNAAVAASVVLYEALRQRMICP